jgi:dTDP-4-dehydrorhamnose reductase
MRIVVLGSNGQVGWALQRAFAPLGDVVAIGRNGRNEPCGDLENADGLWRTLQRLRPDVIANAAAYTDVDRAESEPELADRVNADGPAILASAAKRLDAWLIHYSSDYVFDGSGTKPWSEDDVPAPLCVYGRSKWKGEQAIRDIGCRHIILRTQWVYSGRRHNFVRTVLRLAEERDALEVVADQIGAPTGADLVADVTAHVVRSMTAKSSSGTYHVAARGETTRYGYACFIVEAARRAGWPLRLTKDAIVPIASVDTPALARRPLNGRLAVDRLEQTYHLRMPDWRVGVARVLKELGERRSQATEAESLA